MPSFYDRAAIGLNPVEASVSPAPRAPSRRYGIFGRLSLCVGKNQRRTPRRSSFGMPYRQRFFA